MQRKTKAGIAVGGAAVLLLGGLGTTALWTDDAASTGGEVTTGHLTVTAQDPAITWAPDIAYLVPGDVVTGNQTFDISARGDNLEFTVSAVWDATAAGGPLPAGITVEVDNVAITGDRAIPDAQLPVTDLEEGEYELTADVVVTFDEEATASMDETVDVDNFEVVVSQNSRS